MESPLLNSGKTGNGLNYGSKDIDGDARIINDGLDMGADEYNPETTSALDLESTSAPIIFPNPSADFIHIKFDLIKYSVNKIVIYNIVGKLMSEHSNVSQIDISSLSNGVYLIKLFDGQKARNVFKLVKE